MDLQREFDQLDAPKSIAVGLIIAAIYYFLFFDDGSRIINQTKQVTQDIEEAKADIEKARKALGDKERFQREVDEIYQNMVDFQKYFAPDMNTNKLQANVSTFAEQHGLVVNSLKPEDKQSEFKGFAETAVSMAVEGNFHDIMEFISSLTGMEKAIDFSSMKFSSKTEGDYPKVVLETVLVVYSSNETLGGDAVKKFKQGGNGG